MEVSAGAPSRGQIGDAVTVEEANAIAEIADTDARSLALRNEVD